MCPRNPEFVFQRLFAKIKRSKETVSRERKAAILKIIAGSTLPFFCLN